MMSRKYSCLLSKKILLFVVIIGKNIFFFANQDNQKMILSHSFDVPFPETIMNKMLTLAVQIADDIISVYNNYPLYKDPLLCGDIIVGRVIRLSAITHYLADTKQFFSDNDIKYIVGILDYISPMYTHIITTQDYAFAAFLLSHTKQQLIVLLASAGY